jgi:predicted GIY-YIG superfamily endonuclease
MSLASYNPQASSGQLTHDVDTRIVQHVPSTSYKELSGYTLLQEETAKSALKTELEQHPTDTRKPGAVYVLECTTNRASAGTVIKQGISLNSLTEFYDLGNPRRVIYVGYTVDILERLDAHLNSPVAVGAHFTAMYPPVRVLRVGWFRSKRRALLAEQKTAELLRQEFPEDYIAQPG